MIVWGVQRLATWFLHLMVDTTCSESLWHTLAVTTLFYASVKTWRWWRASRLLPPGPTGLPLVGYLPYITRDFHEELTVLSKKYAAKTGGVFSLRLGTQLIVVLSDHRVIREAFRREEFACRPDNDFMKLLDGYGTFNNNKIISIDLNLILFHFIHLGIVNVEGKMWKEQRRFLHERLRHFGIKHTGDGRDKMEARIMVSFLFFYLLILSNCT